jgi:hypothetical protein
VYDVLGGAAHTSVKAIQAEAKRINTPVKDFSTTLLLAAHKKMAAGEFVAAYWVGDGGVGVYKRGEFVKLLGDGERALFAEHPSDPSNRFKLANAKKSELPWKDCKVTLSLTGPYLSKLFERAFIEGLHHPETRPTADEWEHELIKTVDLIQPCLNQGCEQKWYVFANTTRPVCPFCGMSFKGKLPVLTLYSARKEGQYKPDNHRLMVYTNQSLFLWHANRNVVPNEKLNAEQKQRVGYFVFHNGNWYLVNERLRDLMDVTTETPCPPGNPMQLQEGQQILLTREEGGRLAFVQMVDS